MLLEGVLGEIRMFAMDEIPDNWLPCDGRILNIRDNPALFSLLGEMYGGDARTTFGIPDLRARVPISVSYEREQGSRPAAASAKGNSADQPFLALNFCICATYGWFPPRQ